MEELKYCPFCGESKLLDVRSKQHEDRYYDAPKWTARAMCCRCLAEACNHGFDWTEDEAIEKAIKAWNRRAEDGHKGTD